MEGICIEPIAVVRTPFGEKFAIPHQAGAVENIEARVEFLDKYADENALRGLEGFSHIWLIWHFSKARQEGWSPTVRPPRLGGNKRMGVFATRSPFRPNRLALSLVRLKALEKKAGKISLIVLGADMLDGTAVFDIKPYTPYDVAKAPLFGFAEGEIRHKLPIVWQNECEIPLDEEEKSQIAYLLSCDPRPAYQREDGKIYGFLYKNHNVRFFVNEGSVFICAIENNP